MPELDNQIQQETIQESADSLNYDEGSVLSQNIPPMPLDRRLISLSTAWIIANTVIRNKYWKDAIYVFEANWFLQYSVDWVTYINYEVIREASWWSFGTTRRAVTVKAWDRVRFSSLTTLISIYVIL